MAITGTTPVLTTLKPTLLFPSHLGRERYQVEKEWREYRKERESKKRKQGRREGRKKVWKQSRKLERKEGGREIKMEVWKDIKRRRRRDERKGGGIKASVKEGIQEAEKNKVGKENEV